MTLGTFAALAASGCSGEESEDVQARQRLLSGRERGEARKQRIEGQRVRTQGGDLLPSDTKVAGIVLPRGFAPKFTEKHAWTFDADLPRDEVLEYFGERLVAGSIEKNPLGDVTYLDAREKTDPDMQPVLVKIQPVPARPNASRIHIAEPPSELPPVELDDDVVRRRLAERRLTAR